MYSVFEHPSSRVESTLRLENSAVGKRAPAHPRFSLELPLLRLAQHPAPGLSLLLLLHHCPVSNYGPAPRAAVRPVMDAQAAVFRLFLAPWIDRTMLGFAGVPQTGCRRTLSRTT